MCLCSFLEDYLSFAIKEGYLVIPEKYEKLTYILGQDSKRVFLRKGTNLL
jgi:hypothetical protein